MAVLSSFANNPHSPGPKAKPTDNLVPGASPLTSKNERLSAEPWIETPSGAGSPARLGAGGATTSCGFCRSGSSARAFSAGEWDNAVWLAASSVTPTVSVAFEIQMIGALKPIATPTAAVQRKIGIAPELPPALSRGCKDFGGLIPSRKNCPLRTRSSFAAVIEGENLMNKSSPCSFTLLPLFRGSRGDFCSSRFPNLAPTAMSRGN